MSFLNVAIPVESVDSLLEEIRKQLDVGRFDEPKCDEIEIQPPTREIKGLIEIIQRELQVRLRSLYTLVFDRGWMGLTERPD